MRRNHVSGLFVVCFACCVLFFGTLTLFAYEAVRKPATAREPFYRGTQAKSSPFEAKVASTLVKLPALPEKYKRKRIVIWRGYGKNYSLQARARKPFPVPSAPTNGLD